MSIFAILRLALRPRVRAVLRTPSFAVPTWHLPAAAQLPQFGPCASISCAVVYNFSSERLLFIISVRRDLTTFFFFRALLVQRKRDEPRRVL